MLSSVKSIYQNMTEKFYIYCITKLGKQLNYRNAVHYKPIFNAITI
jgi:hypothetical protein